MHRVDAVGNLPGVGRKLAEGIGSLLGWRKGVRQKKTETCGKIIKGSRKAYRELGWSYNRPRSSLSIGPGFGQCGGFRREFTRRFFEGIGKLAGNTPDLLQVCQRLPNW
ncbi:hypothetical protein BHE74_00034911 [Ensete ventricosum]|nr:hypothetical protein BHE74_00034911 [Ensete ventricosum]RZS23491.1 hypothetical protein BHM03_00056438 [Ensete ventricosum]